jgi:hypothetical protein
MRSKSIARIRKIRRERERERSWTIGVGVLGYVLCDAVLLLFWSYSSFSTIHVSVTGNRWMASSLASAHFLANKTMAAIVESQRNKPQSSNHICSIESHHKRITTDADWDEKVTEIWFSTDKSLHLKDIERRVQKQTLDIGHENKAKLLEPQ